MRVRLITNQLEIIIFEIKNIGDVRVQVHFRQGVKIARQLLFRLLDMVTVEVGITKCMDKLTRLQAGHLSQHQCKQAVGRNIKRHAKKNICATLVKLAGKLAVSDIELEQAVAGRQSHLADIGNIPRRNNQPARIRVGFEHMDKI